MPPFITVPDVICKGVCAESSDGTLNLSYDHENTQEINYDIMIELTGKAAACGEATLDWLNACNSLAGCPVAKASPATTGCLEAHLKFS